ncbi:MAG TPA: TolC family protein [Cyclobacteriaceae bacterium]|nr:TolC family protein [Cyclobacteriaceae bacterium]
MKSTPLLITLLMIGASAFGQQRSLDECIRIALERNELVKNSSLDVQSSEFQVKEAKSALLPTMNLNTNYLYYLDVPSQYAPASAFGGPEGQYSKLVLNLPQTTTAGLQSQQILFDQSVFTGLKAARVVREASQVKLALTQEDIIYNVTATYYTVQVLQDNLARLQENIKNLEKTVTINESLKSNELVSANVHNRLLINLENLRNQYENQRLSYEKNLNLLQYLINVRDEELSVAPFNYEEIIMLSGQADIDQRPDIQLQKKQIKIAEYDKKYVAAGYYPQLVGVSSFGFASYNDQFNPAEQINNDWIKNSSVSVSLKIPVFDGFKKSYKIKQKEVDLQKNINTLSRMKANAEKEVADAVENYLSNSNQVTSSKKSLDLAEQLFTTSQSEFENGLTSTTELLNAQNDLTSARTNYSNALLNLKLAELSWKKSSGTLVTEYITKK